MYIPQSDLVTDKSEILGFMQKYSFAKIITAKNNFPVATHLPFVVNDNNNDIILTSHFAKANIQWKDIEEHISLVIFSEPHAYISPKNYEKETEVPTWNYVAVHTYGKGKLITDKNKVIEVLEKTIDFYEESYMQQWKNIPENYKNNMLKGIVAFEITVTDLQAKKKISKNKSFLEQDNIIKTLSNSNNTNENAIAYYMKKSRSSKQTEN